LVHHPLHTITFVFTKGFNLGILQHSTLE